MENRRIKNITGIIAAVTAVALLLAAVIYTAVDSNKKVTAVEFYIDESPIDYLKNEKNIASREKFSDAVGTYFKSIDEKISLEVFAENLLDSLSRARIPAEKLEKLADILKKNSLDKLLEIVIDAGSDKDKLQKWLKRPYMTTVCGALSVFLKESGLTPGEFAGFLYHYLISYTSVKEYAESLREEKAAGFRKNFTALVSDSVFIMSALAENFSEAEEPDEKTDLPPGTVFAVLYQTGTALKNFVDDTGRKDAEKVLGLRFEFGGEADRFAEKLNDKLIFVLPLTGCVLRAADDDFSELLGNPRGAERIPPARTFAKVIISGFKSFIEEYGGGESLGVDDMSSLKKFITDLSENLYSARTVLSGSEPDEGESKKIAEKWEKYFSALETLTEETSGEEEVADAADVFFGNNDDPGFLREIDYLAAQTTSLWMTMRFAEAKNDDE